MSTADYQSYAYQQAIAYGINPQVFEAQIGQESSWNPSAQNGNASGIAQFMPATAQQYGVDTSDPYSSIQGAAAYDSDLLKSNGGNYTQMLQSYGTLSGSAGQGSSVWQKFQQLISNAGLSGSQQAASGNGGSSSSSSSSTGSCGYTDISCLVSKYGTALLGLILGIILIAAGVWGSSK